MKKVEEKRNRINYKTKEVIEETIIKLIPDKDKCFQSKKTGHKFLYTKTRKGLPLWIKKEKEIGLYNEVKI